MLPELIPFCRQTVQHAARTAVDGYGEPTYGSNTAYRVRISGKRRLVRNFTGEEVVATHTVYFAAVPTIGAHDRITLSTNDVNSTEIGALTPPILNVGKYPDEFGRVSLVAYLG